MTPNYKMTSNCIMTPINTHYLVFGLMHSSFGACLKMNYKNYF